MGDGRIERSGRRYRRGRRLQRGERGVAAVVGTLLALLVFFALFGIFLTQYLPVWMTDNESQFTSSTETAFLQLKSNVDAQSAFGSPTVYAATFPLSSNGVPLLAQPTEGDLILLPTSCPLGFWPSTAAGHTLGAPEVPTSCVFERQAFSAAATTATYLDTPWNDTSIGSVLEMQLPNRYYTSQTFYFENDAVIQEQYGYNAVIVGPPNIVIAHTSVNTTVRTTFVGLYGNATDIIGQGSEEVYTELLTNGYVPSTGLFEAKSGSTITNVPFTYTFQIGTRYVCPWYTYLTHLMSASGLASSAYTITSSTTLPPTTTVCQDATGDTYVLTLKVPNVAYGAAVQSSIDLSMASGIA